MLRDGRSYVEALRDGRRVIIDGKTVDDVTKHPAFRNAVASFAALYDAQAQPEHRALLTIPWGDDGRRVNRAWMLPHSHAELVLRRQAIERWSELHLGFLGRSPDHLATTLGGMMIGIDVLRAASADRADALAAYFDLCARNDLFVSYVIRNPQADRSRSASEQARDVVLHVESEDADGITVSGAKMLGTSAIMSDELFVGSIEPLKPGEERYALSFAVPIATPGLTLLSRRSYEAAANSAFDYPLSSHLDENDAIVHFDRVRVPWSRVFVCGDVALVQAQWHATPAHVYQNYQSQIRLMVKLRFLAGLAMRIARTNGVAEVPQVRTVLGRLAAEATMVEGLVIGMEAAGMMRGEYFVPSAPHLYAALAWTQEMVPRFMLAVRELAGGGVIMLPSSIDDLVDPQVRPLVEATQVSAATDAAGRISVMKLAWDALGSEFASRHMQYEMFYGGANYVNLGNMARTFDWERAAALVEHGLSFGRASLKP